MFRAEAILRSDKHIPFSITRTDAGPVIPKATSYYEGFIRGADAREVNLSGYQLVVGFACFLGAAQLLLWAILKLWLFEP